MSLQVLHTNGQPRSLPDKPLHAFLPPNGATRSPCPCLNTLANHSYLPHNGRNITFLKLVSALQNGMGISRGFALFLAVGSFILLRRPSLQPFDLHGASRHNFIEHNASMIHDDADPGEEFAPSAVDSQLLNEFLGMAHPSASRYSESKPNGGDVITVHDIAARRVEREAVSLPVDALHAELARGEFAMVVRIFGKGKDNELDRAEMKVFLKENRIPDGWSPSHTMHLWEAIATSASLRHAMREIGGKARVENVPHPGGVLHWFQTIVKRLVSHESVA